MDSKMNIKNVVQKDYNKYPFMDLSLQDIRGEEWVSIEGLDDYFYVSTYGRVWALARPIYASDGKFYYIKERIRKQSLIKRYNRYTKDFTEQLYVHIRYGGAVHHFLINRLVYNAFVEPIDFEEDGFLVVHKDGDNCNNRYQNLVLMNGTQLYRHGLELKRRPRSGSVKKIGKRLVWSDENISRPIIRYSLDAKKRTEYESLTDAAKKNNVSRGSIRKVAAKQLKQLNGFVYCYKGEKYTGEYADYSRSKKVTQYSIDGKKVSVFVSVEEASIATGIDASSIGKSALRKKRIASGYVWRYQNDNYTGEYKGKIKENARPIKQYSLDGKIVARFPSIAQAEKETGFSASTIKACAVKDQKVAHGFVWRFEHEKYSGEYKNYRKGKPVTQHDLNGKKMQTFPTIEAAAKATGLTPDNIQKNVKGENKTAGGFIWRHATSTEIQKLPAFKGHEYKEHGSFNKPVIQYSIDGHKLETYPSITEAAKANDISAANISFVLNKPGRMAGGLVWRTKGNRYYGEIAKSPSANKAKTITQYSLNGKKLNVFNSTKEASRKTGASSSTISSVARGKLKTTSGFIWQYGDGPKKIDLDLYFASTEKKLEKLRKSVVKYTLEGEQLNEYPSIAEAARTEKISKNSISRAVNGGQLSAGGHVWKLK